MTGNDPSAVAREVQTLFSVGAVGGLTDGQLLERFASRRDAGAEAAFAALVQRHGPMVWGVCRQALDDPHAAADAFQATFLVRKIFTTSKLPGAAIEQTTTYRPRVNVAIPPDQFAFEPPKP